MISFGANLTQLTPTLYKLLESAFYAQDRAEVSQRSGIRPPAMRTQSAVDSVHHCASCKGTTHALKIAPTSDMLSGEAGEAVPCHH